MFNMMVILYFMGGVTFGLFISLVLTECCNVLNRKNNSNKTPEPEKK